MRPRARRPVSHSLPSIAYAGRIRIGASTASRPRRDAAGHPARRSSCWAGTAIRTTARHRRRTTACGLRCSRRSGTPTQKLLCTGRTALPPMRRCSRRRSSGSSRSGRALSASASITCASIRIGTCTLLPTWDSRTTRRSRFRMRSGSAPASRVPFGRGTSNRSARSISSRYRWR